MPIQHGIPERISGLTDAENERIDEIVRSVDRSSHLWRQEIIVGIRTYLSEQFGGLKSKRIAFGYDVTGDQIYFGTFEHWGDRKILFVPSSSYMDFIAFAKVHKNPPDRLGIIGFGFTTARNNYDNAFFALELLDWVGRKGTGPSGSLQIDDAGGTDKLKVPEEQNRELYNWFANII